MLLRRLPGRLMGSVGLMGGGVEAYYVDQTDGNDGNDGLSRAAPWKTIAKVNGESFVAGDHILFKRGEIWREKLTIPSSGEAGNPVTFGAYGSGNKPIFSGTVLMGSWNDEGGNIYNAALVVGTSPGAVWFDDIQGDAKANKPSLVNDLDWWWDSNVLYIYSDTDPSGRIIEASTINKCLDQNEKSYLQIENIKTDKSKLNNIEIKGNATDITLYRVESNHTLDNGIFIDDVANLLPSNVTLLNCTISLFNRGNGAQGPGILIAKGTAGGGDNFVVRNCTIYSDVDTPNSGNSEDGIIIADGDNILIENNNISGVDHGIQMRGSGVASKAVETFIIRYNILATYDDAIFLNGTSEADSSIYYNLITLCGDQYFDIIGEGGTIYNNTCYGGLSSAVTLQDLAATKVIFKNNIIYHADNQLIIYIDDTDGVDISNSTFDNNLYYRAAPSVDFWAYMGGGGGNFADWQSTHGQDANGLNEDSDFVNPGTDFTLQASSPCRDAGVGVGLIRDYAGVAVPQETNPTMGAFEYTG